MTEPENALGTKSNVVNHFLAEDHLIAEVFKLEWLT